MKKIITIPTLIGIFFLIAGIATGLILIQGTQTFRLGASPQSTPKDVRITNITDTSFSVSWITDAPTSGFVKYGESETNMGRTALDEISTPSETHFVTVNGLASETPYFFKISSAGEDYDANGIAWSATTAPTIGSPLSTVVISGNVQTADKTPKANALVFAQVSTGSSLGAYTSSEGNWVITLSNMRSTPGLGGYTNIDPSQTVVNLFVQGGTSGLSTAKILPISANPTPSIILGQVHDFTTLEQVDSSNTPNASLNLPIATVEPQSKFDIDETVTVPAATAPVTLESHDDGEIITTTEPEFFGEGPPGVAITITVESDPITQVVTVNKSGGWSWEVPQDLEPGSHKLTVSWRDAQGILRTLTRSFIVSAAEGPAFEASSSGSTATPTPTATPTSTIKPTATPTVRPTATVTPSANPTALPAPIPDSGSLTPTFVLSIMSMGLLLLSAAIAFLGS